MKARSLLIPILVLAAIPAMAQCGPSRGGHSGHGGSGNHSGQVQESGPKVKATNTICPAMGQPVKPGRDREVVIRGNYYLVCCDGCGPELAENYDKYFDKEGRPLNAPSKDDTASTRKEEKPVPPAPAPTAHSGHQH